MDIKQTESGIQIDGKLTLPKHYSPKEGDLEKITFALGRKSKLQIIHDGLRLGNGSNTGWDDYKKAYEKDTIDDAIGNKLNMGSAYAFIETKHAEEVTNSPKARVEAIHKQDKKYAPLVEKCLMDEWKKSGSDVQYFKTNKSKNILGAGVMMTGWEKKIRKVYDDKGKLVDMLEYEGIVNRNISLDNFYPAFDSRVSDIELMDDCFLRVDVTKDAFDAQFKNDKKYKNTEFVIPDGSDINFVTQNEEEQKVADQDPDKIHLWFYYNKPKDWFCIISENGVLLFDGHLPCHKQLPFAIFVNHYQIEQLYGRSEVGLVKPISDYLNELNNTWLFSAKMGAAPITLMQEDLTSPDYPELDFEITPQSIWRVSDIDKIKPLNQPQITSDVYNAIDRLNNQMVFITGVNPYETMSRPGNESAYEKRRQYESMKTRIRADQAFNDMTALNRVLTQNLALIQKYYPIVRDKKLYNDVSENGYKVVKLEDYDVKKDTAGKIKEIVGAKGVVTYVEMTEDILNKPFRVETVPNSTIAESDALKQMQKDEIFQRLMLFAGTPAGQSLPWNWEYIATWYVEDMNMDTSRLFRKEMAESPDDENYKVEEGGEIAVTDRDDHADHILRHIRYIKILEGKLARAKEVYKTLAEPDKRFIAGKYENAINILKKHIESHGMRRQQQAMQEQMIPQQTPQPQQPQNQVKPTLGEVAGQAVNMQNR